MMNYELRIVYYELRMMNDELRVVEGAVGEFFVCDRDKEFDEFGAIGINGVKLFGCKQLAIVE